MLGQGEFSDALRRFRRVFYAVGAFSCAINVLLLVPAVYMLQMYDRVLTSRNEATLLMLTLLMLGLLALAAALEYSRSLVLVRTAAALDLGIDGRIFEASFERRLAGAEGDPVEALRDLGAVRRFLSGRSLLAFFDAPWTPVYLLIAFLLNPWLGLFALAAILALVSLAWAYERATGPLAARTTPLASAARRAAAGYFRNSEAAASMGMVDRLRARWLTTQNRYLAAQVHASELGARMGALSRFARLVFQTSILGLGAWLVLQNQLTAGGMIAASILLGRALAPVDLAIATWREFLEARNAYVRLDALLGSHRRRTSAVELPRPKGEVVAENLIVTAPGDRTPILKGLRFRVEPGTVVAIVGPSASGKSTLARALAGIWPPAGGALRLDDVDMHGWDRARLGRWIGYLPQDVELFEGTIAENIARFEEIDSPRVLAAARQAGIHEMVLQFPAGYDTPIGVDSTILSAGQRQRIALARALYGEPALVVLDEPNSNLDEAGDAGLLAAIGSLKAARCTVFLVTHRANILQVADRVLILSAGMIRAFGARKEVARQLGLRPPEGVGPSVDAST